MHIFFLDPGGRGYDPQTPFREPLGGTQSAVAYLSGALARLGVRVSLLNNSESERIVDGVHILANGAAAGAVARTADLVVVVSTAVGRRVRGLVSPDVPMVFWCHLPADQPSVASLADSAELDCWSAFVMVSQWQVENYLKTFALRREKTAVIGNAVSPVFSRIAPQPGWFETGEAPTLVYTSVPYRGLDVLLSAYALIRSSISDVRLKVFSGMKLYGETGPDPFRHLYALARLLPGSEYGGVVSQSELANALAGAAVFSYPCTFAESACIAAMEGMALGAEPITSDLGALSETLAGFGRTTPYSGSNIDLIHAFADTVIEALTEARQNPIAAAARRAAQIAWVREHYDWDARARRWLAFAEIFAKARRDGVRPLLEGF